MIPTEKDVIKKWSSYSKEYSESLSEGYIPMGLSMFNIVCGKRAENILELGCGNGALATEIILKKKKEAKFVGVDLVEPMCIRARLMLQNLESIVKSGEILGYYQNLHEEVGIEGMEWKKGEIARFPLLNSEIHQGSAEDLHFLEAELFDSVVSVLTLHIVPDPSKMLRECFRVMK